MPQSEDSVDTALMRWYKLIVGGLVIASAVALLFLKYLLELPVKYEDLGILVAIGAGLLQIDIGLNVLRRILGVGGPRQQRVVPYNELEEAIENHTDSKTPDQPSQSDDSQNDNSGSDGTRE